MILADRATASGVHRRFDDLLDRPEVLAVDAAGDVDAAARIYRQCRRAGVTPRGLLDCLVAAVAWRSGAALLSNDQDLVRIAAVMDIELDPAAC